MKIIKVTSPQDGSRYAYRLLTEAIDNGAKVLGLATGSTPLGLYRLMCEDKRDYRSLISVNLDEYVGIQPDNPQSYHYFMRTHLFSAKPFKQTYIPDGTNPNAAAATKQYDQILAANPIDLQILGIGQNGHIGFNEPGTAFDSKTHRVRLTESTIAANSRFFSDQSAVPRYAYTMGLGSIMQAKQIILLAFGKAKAAAIHQMTQGKVTPAVPASLLQKHQNATVIVDKEAGSQLA